MLKRKKIWDSNSGINSETFHGLFAIQDVDRSTYLLKIVLRR